MVTGTVLCSQRGSRGMLSCQATFQYCIQCSPVMPPVLVHTYAPRLLKQPEQPGMEPRERGFPAGGGGGTERGLIIVLHASICAYCDGLLQNMCWSMQWRDSKTAQGGYLCSNLLLKSQWRGRRLICLWGATEIPSLGKRRNLCHARIVAMWLMQPAGFAFKCMSHLLS